MSYASRSGQAKTNSRDPRAFGVCGRCGRWFNHFRLRFQFDWAGTKLINKQVLVCKPCYDIPQQQLRVIVLPADPMPIRNPRPENFDEEEN